MKPLIPTTLILSSLALLAFTFLLPTSSSNQLAAIASTPSITFKESTLSVTEGDRLKVTIVAPSTLTATTRVKVTTKSGTAKSGSDFTPVNTTVTFYKGGLKEKTITLSTKSDSVQEQPETLSLSLSVGNKVVNTTAVTLNNKGTGGTPGSSLPATANQGNTLGGNPSFTTYSPQGLPQPMNPKCKQVPSKYAITRNKFPPNNPSNPFYTWEDLFGATYPLELVGGGNYYTFALKALGYLSFQFQAPPVESPLTSIVPPAIETAYYPFGTSAWGFTFISECPWQDYYDEVIAFEGGTSPIAKEFNEEARIQGYSNPVFMESDLYKRWTAEKNRIEKLAGASGRCSELNAFGDDALLDVTYDKEYFDASFNTIQTGDNNPPQSIFCYVKPGGTYYMTIVSHNNDMNGYAEGVMSRQRTFLFYPLNGTNNDIFRLPYGFSDNSAISRGWTMPLAERLALKERVLRKRTENIMNHPDITKYGILESFRRENSDIQIPILKSKKICLLGDPVRADCWMGKFGVGIEKETDRERQEANQYVWKETGDSVKATNLVCPADLTANSPCNSPERYDTNCNNINSNVFGEVFRCALKGQGLSGGYGVGPY